MGWLVALIEIIASVALGLFGVEVETADLCASADVGVRTVEYVPPAGETPWQPASYSAPAAPPCPPDGTAMPEGELVFLIEI